MKITRRGDVLALDMDAGELLVLQADLVRMLSEVMLYCAKGAPVAAGDNIIAHRTYDCPGKVGARAKTAQLQVSMRVTRAAP